MPGRPGAADPLQVREVGQQAVDQGPGGTPGSRVDGEAGGLVHHDHRLVGVEHRQAPSSGSMPLGSGAGTVTSIASPPARGVEGLVAGAPSTRTRPSLIQRWTWLRGCRGPRPEAIEAAVQAAVEALALDRVGHPEAPPVVAAREVRGVIEEDRGHGSTPPRRRRARRPTRLGPRRARPGWGRKLSTIIRPMPTVMALSATLNDGQWWVPT